MLIFLASFMLREFILSEVSLFILFEVSLVHEVAMNLWRIQGLRCRNSPHISTMTHSHAAACLCEELLRWVGLSVAGSGDHLWTYVWECAVLLVGWIFLQIWLSFDTPLHFRYNKLLKVKMLHFFLLAIRWAQCAKIPWWTNVCFPEHCSWQEEEIFTLILSRALFVFQMAFTDRGDDIICI